MRILHVLDHSIPLHSGYTFRTRSILREQRNRGWETCHITSCKHNQALNSASPLKESTEGLEFYRTNEISSPLNKLPVVNQWMVVRGLQARLEEVIRLESPDILHAHSPALNGLAAVIAGKKLNIPVVYEIRAFWEDAAVDHGTAKEDGWRYRLTRQLETYVIRKADAVTTICNGLKQDIAMRGIAESKVTVIPNAVDVEKFTVISQKSKPLLAQLQLENAFVVGFIGSFYAYEGLNILLDAVRHLKMEIPELRILLVGGGPEEQSLRQQVKEQALDDIVVFTGRIPHSEVNDYYSIIDVLAYPRLEMRLTELVTPLKPLEAMAQKSLFVASDVGGHRELIADGENGLLFSKGSSRALAEKIMHLKKHPELKNSLKENGRAYVEKERNWQKSVANYSRIYSGLVSKKLAKG